MRRWKNTRKVKRRKNSRWKRCADDEGGLEGEEEKLVEKDEVAKQEEAKNADTG